jgi:BirA family biotin operon repressor/biotin-[acetyl-CoA-carboxylase] ligase
MTPCHEWRLPTRRLGRRVLVFDRLDSTNNHAAALARDPANDGAVVLAREQSAGRGQHGRSWLCTRGTGVLLSVLLFPPPPLRRPALLTAWAAVSVCAALRDTTGLDATIKWPNDILIRGRKVCGILTESRVRAAAAEDAGQGRAQPERELAVIVGIGLNVWQTAADLADLPQAGSLALCCERPPACDVMARELITQLDEQYDRLSNGDLETLEAAWRSALRLLGQRVVVETHGGLHPGCLTAVGWDGLVLDEDGGPTRQFVPEAVLHIHAHERAGDG